MRGRVRRLLDRLKGTPPALTTEELVRLVLDRAARPSDRDDAAIELGRHDDPAVEAALLRIVRDPMSGAVLKEDCGLSLAEIWSRRDRLNVPLAATLPPPVLRIALSVLTDRRPEWKGSLVELDSSAN
ncbi:MAG TPA: hypothetical protein VK845_02090 [Gemmatimonadales bacterium]|nr:hypothetical protein [Gemmatimonadales bacterium]